jgi:hypothetical protein
MLAQKKAAPLLKGSAWRKLLRCLYAKSKDLGKVPNRKKGFGTFLD